MLLWSAIFNAGRTYGNYLNFVRKACFYLSLPTDSYAPAVVNAPKGIRAARKGKFRFPNFIRSEVVLKAISAEAPSSQFAQLAFCAYLFALRVPSEALILRRAFLDDPLDMGSPQFEKVLISVRYEGGSHQLVLKLAYRKNLPTGCVLYRPCFCEISGAPQLHRFFPVRFWWKWVCSRVPPGRSPFSELSARNINRAIKAVFSKIGVSYAQSYTSHGFRRGAAQ